MVPPDVFRDQPVLVGDRVRLEPLGVANAGEVIPGMVDMDPQVRRLTGTHREFTAEQLLRVFAAWEQRHDRADWVVREQRGGAAVGDCALIDLDPDNAEAHYRVALSSMEHTGRGYGTEATDLVLEYAFETAGLHRVALEVFAFNTNAERSYARSGFVREGVWRQHLRWDGEWHDAVLMSILADEYAELRRRRG
ncbi:aminoglycoside N(6')-acetyltransferase [Nocardiopsis terrae]|uniref:RimJ/RimL family protein N-acetyltransferase n=1 Tax=Nocardiopsis terrae TaxID=372655 RepID=A0ABR9HAK5_9ACTN|nr:GNAT family protein [Nocardiopsis terrae]MBE1456061.1 RimJ/RimL family protein N-acetyltransferase [Nocardiopsis terrae]GHC96078.1 aminoglycoside N(6')-acetyltransferase [Nocardiopsis terrae]